MLAQSNTSLHKNQQIDKLDFYWRAGIFVILEAAFLGFGYRCLTNPIPINLPSYLSIREARGAATVLSISWHSLTGFLVKDVIYAVFSAEFSTITSGLLVQTSTFFTKTPTLEYRLAFVLLLAVLALGPLGGSVVNLEMHTCYAAKTYILQI
ncbi:hypothetical protein D9756_005722 [Leucocoprinus leucothites]|uniref:Uncharacterized protein n=1 Tax=Leucocoprinus leucothites TaxID=201217 RepID=A0A8H5D775_9AGAR|nr:hypothetical protein D9756_005722 [Leucoagaricus leucothites]